MMYMILRLILTVIVAALVLSGCPMPDAPPAMFAPALIAGDGQLTASWAELAAIWNEVNDKDGGNAITAYNLRYGEFDSGIWMEINTGITGTSHTITELTNGLRYAVQVRAVNAGGAGTWSASATATPIAPPTAPPVALAAPTLVAGDGQLTVTWTAPTDTGGSDISAYHLRYREYGSGSWEIITEGIDGTSHVISDLTNGSVYEVQARAVNADGGIGAWSESAVSTLPALAAVPDAPVAPTLYAGTGRIVARWSAPENNGSEITGYELIYREVGITAWTDASGITGTDHTITGLTNGALYQVHARAINAVGIGPWSAPATEPLPSFPPTEIPSGEENSINILLADNAINTAGIANENLNLSVSLTTVEPGTLTVDDGGDLKVTTVTPPGTVTLPTVNASTGIVTVTAGTTAGIYVIYGETESGDILFAEYFSVTESPTTNAELKTAVNAGISNWGDTADLNYIITAAVTNMNGIFSVWSTFNGDVSLWDVSSVTDMSIMFSGTTVFNGDISGWDVSSVTNMEGMFLSASAFNGDISLWDVSSVTNMNTVFFGANAFNQNLENWAWDNSVAPPVTWKTTDGGGKWDDGTYIGSKTTTFFLSGLAGNTPSWF